MNNENTVYVLRRCMKDNIAYKGFTYPKSGFVEAPDWENTEECGKGLHGWTIGFDGYFDNDLKGNFIVLKVDKNDDYIELKDKVKFRKGEVVLNTPDKMKAINYMRDIYPDMIFHWDEKNEGDNANIITGSGATITTGYRSTITAKNESTITAENWSTIIAGHRLIIATGDCSKITTGDGSTITTGNWSTITAGLNSTITAEKWSTIVTGDYSTITAGNDSKITTGDCSKIITGDCSKITAGYDSTITTGDDSIITTGFDSIIATGFCSIITAGSCSTIAAGNWSTITAGYDSIIVIDGNSLTFYCEGINCKIAMFYNDEIKTFKEGIDFRKGEKIVIEDGEIVSREKI